MYRGGEGHAIGRAICTVMCVDRGSETGGWPCESNASNWKKETTDTKKNNRTNSMLKPKNAAQLVGHAVALDMVLTGLDSITVGDLSPKTKLVVEAFVKDKTTEVNDSTTVSYLCSHVIAPDLKKSVPTRGDDGAFETFKKIIYDLKSPSSQNLRKFHNASTDLPGVTDTPSRRSTASCCSSKRGAAPALLFPIFDSVKILLYRE